MGRKAASESMTEAQKKRFTENFRYMWDVLETSYYYVVGQCSKCDAAERRNGINNDMGYLPVYSVCSGYYNGKKYPDRSRLGKLVLFYNTWISPGITASDFLDTDLYTTGARRKVKAADLDSRYEGTYYGYYPSSAGGLFGACLFLKADCSFPSSPVMKAALISGFRTDEDMQSKEIRKMIQLDSIPDLKAYRDYFESLPQKKRKTCFYEGTAEISPQSAVIALNGSDGEFRRLTVVLNVKSFPKTYRFLRAYGGGLGYVLSSGSSGTDPRFYRIGLMRADQKFISLSDENLIRYLKPDSLNAVLTPAEDRDWIEFVWEN